MITQARAFFSDWMQIKNDILSGLTVALALVPEAVAFAFVAGVHPLVGIHAAILIGLFAAILGGRPGMISGATGALAVVMVSLVAQHGVEYLFAAVVLMGIIQIAAGVLQLGKFARFIPHPVMLGFVNGLAIVILLSQLNMFKAGESWMTGTPLALMIGFVALTMAIIFLLPRLTKAVPSSLVAIALTTGLVAWLGLETSTVKDFIINMGGEGFAGTLPIFHIPLVPLSWEMIQVILPYSLILAAIGLIESLMTLTLIDEITETHGDTNRECLGQGIANVITGFFGGMGGCAMIGQSMININSGGRGRLSGIAAALFLLAFLLFAAPLIEMVPLAALVGVMFVVVFKTFAWGSLRILGKVPRSDIFVIVLVTVVTVLTDLAIAVACGVIVSALVFAWQKAQRIDVEIYEHKGIKHYAIKGPLFFASTAGFAHFFSVKDDPAEIVVDFADSRVVDHSALEAIHALASKYRRNNKKITLRHLSADCRQLLENAGDTVEVAIDDPEYTVTRH